MVRRESGGVRPDATVVRRGNTEVWAVARLGAVVTEVRRAISGDVHVENRSRIADLLVVCPRAP